VKPIVRGKKLLLREVVLADAEFILSLRGNPEKNQHLSPTSIDIVQQREFIKRYQNSLTDYYFIITSLDGQTLGTVRIYDIRGDSFCWGSWIIAASAPNTAATESCLLLYDFAFFALHYRHSHFDVRKENTRVVNFHRKMGASITSETDLDYYFSYSLEEYKIARARYARFLPE